MAMALAVRCPKGNIAAPTAALGALDADDEVDEEADSDSDGSWETQRMWQEHGEFIMRALCIPPGRAIGETCESDSEFDLDWETDPLINCA